MRLTRFNTCMHRGHKDIEYRIKTSPDRSGIPTPIFSGYNPIHRRWEICDQGFVAPKKKINESSHNS